MLPHQTDSTSSKFWLHFRKRVSNPNNWQRSISWFLSSSLLATTLPFSFRTWFVLWRSGLQLSNSLTVILVVSHKQCVVNWSYEEEEVEEGRRRKKRRRVWVMNISFLFSKLSWVEGEKRKVFDERLSSHVCGSVVFQRRLWCWFSISQYRRCKHDRLEIKKIIRKSRR